MPEPVDVRQITDARVLAALAHPVRSRLIDLLKLDGPSTASVLAQRTGQAVGNISHHLRALGAVELIEEAPDLARDRRERWWRLSSPSLRWTSRDFVDDPAAEAVAFAAESLNLERQVGMVRAWTAAGEAEHRRWELGPFSTDSWVRATDAELAELAQEVVALLRRWADRDVPDDGAERGPVFVFARGVPATP